MRRLVSSSLVVGTVAVGVIGLSATSAFAWTVTGGPNITATNAGPVQFKDTTTNQPFTCTASTIKGTVFSNAVIGITSGTFTGCTGNFGAAGTATISAGTLTPVTYSSGITSYVLTRVSASLSFHDLLGACTATVTGSANIIRYSNNGILTVTADPAPGNLTIPTTTGSGCSVLIAPGNKATFAGKYSFSPVITITNP